MDIKKILEEYHLKPDPLKDQFFLQDEEVLGKIIGFANLNKDDVVLEIGAGIGNLTKEIAKKAKKVIVFEIDSRFRPFLNRLPKNVEIHWENAWSYVQLHGKFRKKKEYNKIVSNLPYSFTEPFLHNLTFLDYDKAILLIPVKFLKKGHKWGIFDSFFKVDIKMEVNKNKFYPTPRTNSVVIDLLKVPDPATTKNSGLFLRQYIYQHESQLVKNSLMEGIIKYAKLVYDKSVTKNQARKIVLDSGIEKELLEKAPDNSRIYEEVSGKLKNLFADDNAILKK